MPGCRKKRKSTIEDSTVTASLARVHLGPDIIEDTHLTQKNPFHVFCNAPITLGSV